MEYVQFRLRRNGGESYFSQVLGLAIVLEYSGGLRLHKAHAFTKTLFSDHLEDMLHALTCLQFDNKINVGHENTRQHT